MVTIIVFQAEGYADGDLTLFHSFTVTDFLKAENAVDFLGKTSEVRSPVLTRSRSSSGDGKTKPLIGPLGFFCRSRSTTRSSSPSKRRRRR